MRIYKIKHSSLVGWLALDKVENIAEEVKMLLPESIEGDEITILVSEMSEEEYNNLPEFEGY